MILSLFVLVAKFNLFACLLFVLVMTVVRCCFDPVVIVLVMLYFAGLVLGVFVWCSFRFFEFVGMAVGLLWLCTVFVCLLC